MLEITKKMNADESTPLLENSSRRQTRRDDSTRNNEAGLALTIVISLLTAGIMVVILAIMGQGHRYDITKNAPRRKHRHRRKNNDTGLPLPFVIEMAQFQLNDGVACEDFLKQADALKPFFDSTNHTIQRSLAYSVGGCGGNPNNSNTTVFVDLVYWETMGAALQAAIDIINTDIAQPFLNSINASTLTLQHFIIDLDWRQLQQSDVVEVALFELNEGVSEDTFLQDAQQITPFFEDTPAAKHRILSHGYEHPSIIWNDLVYWTSVKEAKEAAEAIEKVPACRPFLEDVNVTSPSFSFEYYQVGLWQDFQQ